MKRLDKFSLLIENEEMGKEVRRIADKAGVNKRGYAFTATREKYNKQATYYFENGNFIVDPFNTTDYPLITLSEFKQMFEPEIEMYKAKSDFFKSAICKLCAGVYSEPNWSGFFGPNSAMATTLIEHGVLELWCNPIYKESSKTVMVGGKEWKVTKDKVHIENGFDLALDALTDSDWSLHQIIEVFGTSATLLEIKNLVEAYKSLNK